MRVREMIRDLDRRKVYIYLSGLLIAVVVIWLITFLFARYGRLERLSAAKRGELNTFNSLREEYLRSKRVVDGLDRRLLSTKGGGSPMTIMEEIGRRLRLSDRIAGFRPIKGKTMQNYRERGVEVQIDGIDINEVVNLLYTIDRYNALLLVKDFTMKSRFDNPDLFDISINIVLVSKTSE